MAAPAQLLLKIAGCKLAPKAAAQTHPVNISHNNCCIGDMLLLGLQCKISLEKSNATVFCHAQQGYDRAQAENAREAHSLNLVHSFNLLYADMKSCSLRSTRARLRCWLSRHVTMM